MKEFKDKVAVVTGSASGIGRGLAERSAREGMKVVLADVEEQALAQAEKEMKAAGASVLTVLTDVSKASDVAALAQKTLDTFGGVHLLCNNAGVSAGGLLWESTQADWEWVMGVNLWGVINGVRTFTPIMLEQDTQCHIVNTASMAGLISSSGNGIYAVTKHGVVALSETLYHQLAQVGANVNVSVLCPGLINTQIMDCARNRPAGLQNDPAVEMKIRETPEYQAAEEMMRLALAGGMPPIEVADCVFNAVIEEKFYILANADPFKPMALLRMEDVVQEPNPTSPSYEWQDQVEGLSTEAAGQ